MVYNPPSVASAGLTLPSYQDIIDDFVSQALSIYGQDIYLDVDSQDYQQLSVIASKLNDAMQLLQYVYNSRGPSTAIGSGLDSLVKLNGIARLPATYSTCLVTVSGTAGTVINNGVIQDASGYSWSLPSPTTIGTGGTVAATATCQTAGPVSAAAGTITKIMTPTYGWTSVTNAAAATPGVSVELDSALRSRQAVSSALPSRTILEGTEAAIAAVSGVTRFVVYENDTGAADSNGLPAHSITAVVEGGAGSDVANAIWAHKGPGCLANGTTSVTLTDSYGLTTSIGFYRPAYVDFDVVVNVHGLAGYTTATTAAIQMAIASYLSSLALGTSAVLISSLWGAALSVQTLTTPIFSITSLTAAIHGGVQGTSDISLAFNQVARGNAAYITVTVS